MVDGRWNISLPSKGNWDMMNYQSALDHKKQTETENDKIKVLDLINRFVRLEDLSRQEKREIAELKTKFENRRKMYDFPFSNEDFLIFLRKSISGDPDALSVILKQPSRRNPYEKTIEEIGKPVGISKCNPNSIIIEDGNIRRTTKGRLTKGKNGVDVDFQATNTNSFLFGNVITLLYISAKHTETGSNGIYERGGSSQNHNIKNLYEFVDAAVLARKNLQNYAVGFVAVCDGRYGLQKLQTLSDYIASQKVDGIFAMSADELVNALKGNA